MVLKTKLFGKVYEFQSLREVMAKANEEKSGDALAGIAASCNEERVAAKAVLAGLTLSGLRENPAVPYEEDEVTRIIQDDINETIYNSIRSWTVGELREWLLDIHTTNEMIRKISRGLTSEMIAAVCKLMGNLDLIYAASKIQVTSHCNTTIGLPGTFSSRLQPNHTTDNPAGIMASVMEGLSYGCGDAVIGLNPVDGTGGSVERILKSFDEFKNRWEVPTQTRVLAHITTQMEAVEKRKAPADLIFQSIAAPLPAFLITFANASLFGWWKGAILSWSSAMAGAAICFYIAKILGRDVAEKLTSKTGLEQIDTFFERYGKNTILICRLLPFVSFDIVSYAAGLTSMSFVSFFVATGIGQLPATIVYSYVGGMLTGGAKLLVTALLILFSLSALIFMLRKIYMDRQSGK